MARKKDRIDEFCKLVDRINSKNDYLDKEAANFYDGGHSFEEVYADDISELKEMKSNLSSKIRFIASPRRIGGFG